jgi:biotin carboxyl carrier protein
MYSVSVNGKEAIKTDLKIKGNNFEGTLGEAFVKGDLIKINEFQYHLLHNGNSYNIELIKSDPEEKTMLIKINTLRYELKLKDKYDELLHQLGLDNLTVKQVSDVKAPMPGMVLNILVKEGDSVKKGDALLVLEAMKMENIIKASGDAVIKKITAVKGTAVEKNQLLIQF